MAEHRIKKNNVIYIMEGQYSPNHFHWHKMEDIINRGGGVLLMRVYNSFANEDIDRGVTPDYVLAKETVNRFGEPVVDYSGMYDFEAIGTMIDEYLELPDCVLGKKEAHTYIEEQDEIINDVISNYISDKYGWLHMGYTECGLMPLIEKTLKDNKLIEDSKIVEIKKDAKTDRNKGVDR